MECGKIVTNWGIQKRVYTNSSYYSDNFLVSLKLGSVKGMGNGPRGPDPTPNTDRGPHQAAAGLPCMGLHLLPVLLGFLDDVFVGHACGGRDQTRASMKELSEEGGGGSAGSHPGPGEGAPVPSQALPQKDMGSRGSTHPLSARLFTCSWEWRTCSKPSWGTGESNAAKSGEMQEKGVGPAAWHSDSPAFMPGSPQLLSTLLDPHLPQWGLRPDSCLAASSPLFLGLWAWPRLAH